MNDKRIVELFWNRSELAIDAAEKKYGKMCSAIAMNVLDDPQDAEECVNDTLQGLWDAIPPQRPENLRAFAAKIARNLSLKRLRYRLAEKRAASTVSFEELGDCLPGLNSVEAQAEGKELSRALAEFLRTLDKESRNMFLRRYWFFDSVEQIAKGFGVSESKVKSKLYRVRLKLKEYLAKEVDVYVGK